MIENNVVLTEELSIQEEMQQEMMLQARKKVLEKKVFAGVQEISRSGIHEKFYRVTNEGRKEYSN